MQATVMDKCLFPERHLLMVRLPNGSQGWMLVPKRIYNMFHVGDTVPSDGFPLAPSERVTVITPDTDTRPSLIDDTITALRNRAERRKEARNAETEQW